MYERWVKQFLDKFMAILVLMVLLPLFLLMIGFSAIFHRGKIWFVQTRIGYQGKPFSLIKFQTMFEPGFVKGETFLDPVTHKTLIITFWGKFLRQFSLDELPQLINIIRGQLSWVGPRPLLPEYLPYYTQNEQNRHNVKPGMTGLAQVNGKNQISWSEKLAYDSLYVEKISFWLDFTIVIKTMVSFFKSRKHAMDISLIDERR